MTFALAIEIALTGLLAVTLVYCVMLERRLGQMRRGQDGLKAILADLTGSIAHAQGALVGLKSAAADAAATLDERLGRARSAIDELSLLTASGERIAERFDHAANKHAAARATPHAHLPSGSVMGRLDSLRAVR